MIGNCSGNPLATSYGYLCPELLENTGGISPVDPQLFGQLCRTRYALGGKSPGPILNALFNRLPLPLKPPPDRLKPDI
jgi:hypothetical protein